MKTEQLLHIELEFREGSSDKVYRAGIEELDGEAEIRWPEGLETVESRRGWRLRLAARNWNIFSRAAAVLGRHDADRLVDAGHFVIPFDSAFGACIAAKESVLAHGFESIFHDEVALIGDPGLALCIGIRAQRDQSGHVKNIVLGRDAIDVVGANEL